MRIERMPPERLDAQQRELYEAITGGPRAAHAGAFAMTDERGGLRGPFNAMLLRPALGHALQALGAAIRYRGRLADRHREIAILVVAYAWDCAFEIYAHEALAATVGLTEEERAALRAGTPLSTVDDELVAATTRALVTRQDLTEDEFAAVRDRMGPPAVFELTTLVGYYTTLALQLKVFRV